MRPFLFSLGAGLLVLGVAFGQAPGGGGNMPQVPVGQTYKDFQFPVYQNGQLSYTLSALSAKGITLNHAETVDLKIDAYTQGKVTTTITSPDADLYVADRIMRTKNTVQIERADLEASAQTCDFDLSNKKFLLRANVKVTLKNFDLGMAPAKTPPAAKTVAGAAAPESPSAAADETSSAPMNPSVHNSDPSLDVPGAYATTNSAPIPPPAPINP
jgi:hypothetical protein